MENFACGTLLLSLLGVSKCVDKNRKYYNASYQWKLQCISFELYNISHVNSKH